MLRVRVRSGEADWCNLRFFLAAPLSSGADSPPEIGRKSLQSAGTHGFSGFFSQLFDLLAVPHVGQAGSGLYYLN